MRIIQAISQNFPIYSCTTGITSFLKSNLQIFLMREYSQLSTTGISLFTIWPSPTRVMTGMMWSHLRSKSYMCKGQILGIHLTFPRWRSLSCSILNSVPPPQHAAIFSRKTLSRYFAPPAADPSIGMTPQVVRQQMAVPCNGVPPTTNLLVSRFPAGTNFALIIETSGVGMEWYSVYVQWWHSLFVNRKWNVRQTTKKLLRRKLALHAWYIPHCFQVYYITKQSSSGQRNCYSYLTVHIWKRPNGLEYCTFIASVHLLSLFVSPAPPNNFLNQLTRFHGRRLESNATKRWCELD